MYIELLVGNESGAKVYPVSYTHLDVYKRQWVNFMKQLRLRKEGVK